MVESEIWNIQSTHCLQKSMVSSQLSPFHQLHFGMIFFKVHNILTHYDFGVCFEMGKKVFLDALSIYSISLGKINVVLCRIINGPPRLLICHQRAVHQRKKSQIVLNTTTYFVLHCNVLALLSFYTLPSGGNQKLRWSIAVGNLKKHHTVIIYGSGFAVTGNLPIV